MAALRAREAGLAAAGSVDHDSAAASEEMIAACAILGIGGCSGFEVRVSFKGSGPGGPGPFARRKINNPDSEGIAYMTVQGIPRRGLPRAAEFLRPIREERLKRTRAMSLRAGELLREGGLGEIDFDREVRGASLFDRGGGITERHRLQAAGHRFIQMYGKGPALLEGLREKLGIGASPRIRDCLSDPGTPHYLYDL
jgi:hypothetical protein